MKIVYKRKFDLLYWGILILTILITPLASLYSQDSSIINLENEFSKIGSSISQLSSQRQKLSELVQAYATEIQELKNKDKINYFQRQRLEGLLKDSHDLSKQIETIDSEVQSLNKLYRKTGNQLIRLYDSDINKTLKDLEKKELSPELRQNLIVKIEALRAEKEDVKRKIAPDDLREFRLLRLKIEPEDTPKQIRQKADLLKDQEDKILSLTNQINRQTNELQKELEIRTRIGEFMTDLALFDQQEEALGDVNVSEEALNVVRENQPATDFTMDPKFIQENLLVGQRNFDFSSLSSEQLEDVIDNLKESQSRLHALADSLAQQADAFYKAEQEMKKQ